MERRSQRALNNKFKWKNTFCQLARNNAQEINLFLSIQIPHLHLRIVKYMIKRKLQQLNIANNIKSKWMNVKILVIIGKNNSNHQ